MLQVEQRDVPGIDCAYLAMDTEEGVEVVWNEVQFSERKNFKAQEEKIQQVFENLTQLEHPNIVKFHRYWTDTHNDKPRVCMTLIEQFVTSSFGCLVTCQINKNALWSTGHLHHRVYVIGVLKAVPKTHQTKCQEVTTAGMEEMVYSNPLSAEVKKDKIFLNSL